MSYTRNFGFRDLSNIVRDGRNQVPTGLTGSDANGYLIGTAVTVDPNNPGQLMRPAAAAAPTALSGIVLYEHVQMQGVDPLLTTPLDPPFIYAPMGRFAQMVHGLGVKVWFKNTANTPLYDGRQIVGDTLVNTDLTTIKPGDALTPHADGTWDKTTTAGLAWLTVESVNSTTGLVEARFTF
ncbi:MAG TPA: hypothetical protein VFH56_02720 [Acidimicrobiales bacterium]|nr:hypothetical protein [Acidimicrobiales bacterium]